MIPKSLRDIIEVDLLALINDGVTENRQLEFKRQLPEANDQGKVKFLKAVTALANTAGGDLIYGIEANEGIPESLAPLAVISKDQVLLRLEDLCANGVDPRLTSTQFRWITLSDGGDALVVRVPRSWNAPHRVKLSSQFYARNAGGSFPMDVTELRRAFTLSGEIAERIRIFRASRLMALATAQGPIMLQKGAIGVLHVIPLQSFATDIRVDVSEQSRASQKIHPIGASGWNHRLNIDGLLNYRSDREGRSYGYAQFFRSGIIEAATVYSAYEGQKVLPSMAYERDILRALKSYTSASQALGIETPAYVFFSLLGINGYRMGVSSQIFMETEIFVSDRDVLDFPEITISDWSCDIALAMRPLFDIVWNAFGFIRSFNYDDNGSWVGN